VDNGRNNDKTDNNLLNSTELFSNYNDIFVVNNSVSKLDNDYTNNSNESFVNLINMPVKPNNLIDGKHNSFNDNNVVITYNTNTDIVDSNVDTNPQLLVKNDNNLVSDKINTENINPREIEIKKINFSNNVNSVSNYSQYNKNRIEEIRQKDNNNIPVIFTDGLDEDTSYKKGIKFFLTDRKVITTVLVLAFVFVCIVVAKAFYFGNKTQKYEQFFTVIDEKIDEEARVYALQEIDNEILKKVAASELINCIGEKIDTDNLSDGIKNAIRNINNYYNESYNNFAFAYKDIYTGFTVTYNENQDIFTASTIKAPTDIYVYEMASMGKIDLEKELTYTPKQYVNGSGSIQHQKMYTKYKTRELLRLSTVYSDNIAHNMLMDNYGRTNMLDFWTNLGTTAIFKQNSNWGRINAHDALIYMSELYRFYNENDEYGNQLMNNFMNAVPKFIKGKNGYKVANKSGWTGSAIHDVSIIFADNPYIVVALSNTGEGNYTSYFNKANDLAYNLHTEYWKYKMSLCDSIKQY